MPLYKSPKSGKLIEVESEYDTTPGSKTEGQDLARDEAIAKGWRPVHSLVSKSGKSINVDDDGLDEALGKGWMLPQVRDAKNTKTGISAGESAARGLAQGLSFNLADEGQAGIRSVLTGRPYAELRDEYRERDKAADEEQGAAYLGTQIAGGLAQGLGGLAKVGLGKAGAALTASKVGQLAATSTGQGAIAGFGAGEGDLGSQALSTGVGAGMGFVAPYAMGAVGKAVSKLPSMAGSQALKTLTDTSPEMADKLRATAPEVMANARPRDQIADALVENVRGLKSKVSEGSTAAFDILEKEGVQIPKQSLVDALDRQIAGLSENGLITSEAERDVARLVGIRDRIAAQQGDIFSGGQVKAYIRQLDNAAKESTSAGGFASDDVRAMWSARKDFDSPLKEYSPAYRDAMDDLAKKADTLERANKLFGNEQTVNAKIEGLGRKNANPYVWEALRDLDTAGGTSLADELDAGFTRDYFSKETTNGARKTVLGSVAGGAAGAFLGGPFGSALGGTIGAGAGAYLDKNARVIAERAIRLSQQLDPVADRLGKYAAPLAEAAKKGPAAFILTHNLLLQSQPEYRALVEGQSRP